MKLSIVTICLNNLKELQQTVSSVINQTCDTYEYIIVDGDSIDGCKEYIAQTSRIDYWISEPDTGIYNAMNKGVQMAHGEYILFLNSGDILYSEHVLEKVIPQLNGDDFYAGDYLTERNGKTKLLKSPQYMNIKFLLEGALMHQATFTRTALLKENPYNEKYRIVADWAFLFNQWIFKGRSYKKLNTTISIFAMNGISTNRKNIEQRDTERQQVINQLLPTRILKALLQRDSFSYDQYVEQNIHRALAMPPIKRDLKLFRNSIKFLIRDLIKDRKL